MNETATATAANDTDRTARTVGTAVATIPKYRIKYRDSASYAKFTMSFYGAALGRRIARRDIARAKGISAAKAKARTSFTKAIERKKRKAMKANQRSKSTENGTNSTKLAAAPESVDKCCSKMEGMEIEVCQ